MSFTKNQLVCLEDHLPDCCPQKEFLRIGKTVFLFFPVHGYRELLLMLVGVTKSILVSRAAGDLWLFFFFFAVHGRNLSKDAFLRGLFIYSGDTFMRPITHLVADAVFWPPFRRGQMEMIMNAFLWIFRLCMHIGR